MTSGADTDKLGLGLEDIIRLDRSSNQNRRGGGGRGARGGGASRRGNANMGGRANNSGVKNGFRRGGGGMPRTLSTPQGKWQHDLYDEPAGGGGNRFRSQQSGGSRGMNSTTKLLISNLDYGVTTNDIQELFEDIGPIRVARVHYDESGRSLGTAEVIFERRADAITAQQKYNTLNLDGRPMDIRLVGVDDATSRLSYINGGGVGGNRGNNRQQQQQTTGGRRSNNNQQQQQNGGGRGRGGGGRQQQQNGGGASGKKETPTTEELDAELEAYKAASKKK